MESSDASDFGMEKSPIPMGGILFSATHPEASEVMTPQKSKGRIVVIGAGVIGLMCGYGLRKRGAEVKGSAGERLLLRQCRMDCPLDLESASGARADTNFSQVDAAAEQSLSRRPTITSSVGRMVVEFLAPL